MIYVIAYLIIGCLIGLVAYRQLKGSKMRIKASILACLIWPAMFGMFVVTLIEDLKKYGE